MLNIKRIEEDNNIVLDLEGNLDTLTAPDLKEEISNCTGDFQNLILDFAKVQTLSSAGLRILLNTHQDMTTDGKKLVLRNVPELIMGIFEITGFNDIMNFE
jgi:anti-sigma B factor antagonist